MTTTRATTHRLRPTPWGWQYRTAGIMEIFGRYRVIEPNYSMAPDGGNPMMSMLASDQFRNRPTTFESLDEAVRFADELADATIAVTDEIMALIRSR